MTQLARLIFDKVAAGEWDEELGLELLEALPQGASSSKSKDIAIIGLSLRMPGANSLEQWWHNLSRKQESIGEFPKHRQRDSEAIIRTHTTLAAEDIRYSIGGYLDEVDKFDYDFFQLSPMEAALMDPNQRMFLESCWSAIEDAGYGGSRLQGSRTGVYIGHADWPAYAQYITKTYPAHIRMAGVGNTPSILASRIAYLLNLRGPSLLIDTACSSSLVAVHTACKAIQNGDCDMALTGGVKLCLMPVAGVFEIGIESSRAQTSAFDEHSDGTVWGEGTAALLLKPLDQATADRDHIYAVIKGSALNQDGASVGITAPNASAQEEVLRLAWADAGVEPDSITMFEAHGTGTRLGDPIEIDGIQRAFRRYTDRKQFCAIGSVKTNIGHLDGMSGIAGVLKAIAALRYKQLPPTLHFTRPNSSIPFTDSPVYVQDRLTDWEEADTPRRCGVSSFGFSGTNSHVILEEAPPYAIHAEEAVPSSASQERSCYMLPVSAKSADALQEWSAAYAERLRTAEEPLTNICFTAGTGRGHYAYRLVIMGQDKQELADKLAAYAADNSQSIEGLYAGVHRVTARAKEMQGEGNITPSEQRTMSLSSDTLLDQLQATVSTAEQLRLSAQLAEHYVRGAEVDWGQLYTDTPCRKVSLPTYPFRRVRCWVDDKAGPHTGEQAANTVKLTGRTSGEYAAEEQLIGQIWGELLGLDTLDIYDDFFEIGGNSIQAIKLEVDLARQGITISADHIEADRCIQKLAARMAGADSPSLPEGYPSSASAQETHGEARTEADSYVVQDAIHDEMAKESENSGHTSVVIANMEPFNEVFFKNCFYNSLFPIVRHYGASILPILLNDSFLISKDDSRYEVIYAPYRSDQELFAQLGLSVTAQHNDAHMVERLRAEITNGYPVIVWVDAYELSIRRDAYGKEHMDHTLLIYGYDDQSRQFHVIEHERRENLSYRHQLVSYADMERACHSFSARYIRQGEHEATHYEIRLTGENDASREAATKDQLRTDCARLFAEMLIAHQPQREDSEATLEQFVSTFTAAVSDEARMQASVEDWADFLNQVMNSKQADLYRLKLLLGDEHELVQAAEQLRTSWDTVRKGVVRYWYMPDYNADVLRKLAERLQHAAEQEQRFRELADQVMRAYLQTT